LNFVTAGQLTWFSSVIGWLTVHWRPRPTVASVRARAASSRLLAAADP